MKFYSFIIKILDRIIIIFFIKILYSFIKDYFRGNVKDNYVIFANKTWRIVRINGDGTVRLILDSSAGKSEFNPRDMVGFNAYVGYMYGLAQENSLNSNQCVKLDNSGNSAEVDSTKTTESACLSAGYKWAATPYDSTHINVVSSTIKKSLDTWYETNIKTNYSNYIADTLFCNDKTCDNDGCYATNEGKYGAYLRLNRNLSKVSPTLKCAVSATNDYSRFTVDEKTLLNGNKTNGDLTYPVGLLTADEVSFAGAYKSTQENKSYYIYSLYVNNGWLISPGNYVNI